MPRKTKWFLSLHTYLKQLLKSLILESQEEMRTEWFSHHPCSFHTNRFGVCELTDLFHASTEFGRRNQVRTRFWSELKAEWDLFCPVNKIWKKALFPTSLSFSPINWVTCHMTNSLHTLAGPLQKKKCLLSTYGTSCTMLGAFQMSFSPYKTLVEGSIPSFYPQENWLSKLANIIEPKNLQPRTEPSWNVFKGHSFFSYTTPTEHLSSPVNTMFWFQNNH